jgi:DNA (cytosine-5)-methyltransferase 1
MESQKKKILKKIINSDSDSDSESEENTNKKQITKNNKLLKLIDLCAGTGAFSYAFETTNKVNTVFANDIEQSSKDIYDINFKNKLILGNICEYDVKKIPKHDILTAGFPCQPFSIAGKQNGFDDPRSNVFWKIIEIMKYHKPQIVILENVKNIISHDNGDSLKTILNSLSKCNYHVKYKILNTSDITSVPQHRERVYFLCFKNKKLYNSFNFKFKKIKCKEINDIIDPTIKVHTKYYYNDPKSKIHKMVIDSVIKQNIIYQFRRVYVRENKSGECPTLTANMGTGGHNVPLILDDFGVRKLTPRECFNLQGFPETYKLPKLSDSKLYKLAGNAVSVPVVILIANQILDLLE